MAQERTGAFFLWGIDFIPTEEYGPEDAIRAMRDAEYVVRIAEIVIER